MRVLFYISLIGILIFGCTKAGKNISVKGRVYNPVTNEGIPNIEIRLLKDEEVPSLSGGSEAVKTVYTDANGYYELDHASISSRYIGCFLDNDQYYRIGWIYEGENIGKHTTFVNKGKYTYLDYQIVPYGKFGFNINNINCQNSDDTIIINEQNDVGSLLSIDWIIKGCNGYQSSIIKTPIGNRYISWTVIRNGISNSYSDQVFIGEGQEVIYTLNY